MMEFRPAHICDCVKDHLRQELQASCIVQDVVPLNAGNCAPQPSGTFLPDPSIMTAALVLQDPYDYKRFVFPSFGSTESVLGRQQPISRNVRRLVISTLFQACVAVTWYPSPRLYHLAVDTFLTKYPHLKDPMGTGMSSWKEALSRKFKNERRKMTSVPDMVNEIRTKHAAKRKRDASECRGTKAVRLQDAEHLVLGGETEASIKEHDIWLQEADTSVGDITVYKQRLAITAKARQEHIKAHSVSQALLIYPFLKDQIALLLEFEVVYQRELHSTIEKGFEGLLDIVRQHGTEEEVLRTTECIGDPFGCALKVITERCSEKVDTFLTEKEDLPLGPIIQASDDEYSLFVDKQFVCKLPSMGVSVSALFAAYWVFNIKYPKKGADTLTFIERGILGLEVTKPRSRCLDLLSFWKFHAQ